MSDSNKLNKVSIFICRITNTFRRKGVVRDWFGNGQQTSISGKVELYQQTEYESTDIEFTLNGLSDAGEYHIHRVSIDSFTCVSQYGETSACNLTRIITLQKKA